MKAKIKRIQAECAEIRLVTPGVDPLTSWDQEEHKTWGAWLGDTANDQVGSISNQQMLKAARFIARWNGYELVKKKEKR